MLLTVLAWLYISWNCFAWGHLVIRLAGKKLGVAEVRPDLSIACFTGLLTIGACSLWTSLFTRLGAWPHAVMLAVSLCWLLSAANRRYLSASLYAIHRSLNWPVKMLLASCILLVLVVCSYEIKHPDTLIYHAQAIHWFELYKAVPGIVHIDSTAAMTNLWFAAMAMFRFEFLGHHPFLFLNGAVLCWYFLFLCTRMGETRSTDGYSPRAAAGWLLLLGYTLLSWTQVRLTAASASPDFVVTLLCWGVFYLFLKGWNSPEDRPVFLFLSFLFACGALITKLSVIALAIVPLLIVAWFLRRRQFTTALLLVLTGLLFLLPFCIRNLVSSGYPFYPASIADIFSFDWKYDPTRLLEMQEYIKAYARDPDRTSDVHEMAVAGLIQWVPVWWRTVSLIDKLLLGAAALALVYGLFTIRWQSEQKNRGMLPVLLVSLAGSVLWFLYAPSVRFGTGFLVPLLYCLGKNAWPAAEGKMIRSRIKPSFFHGLLLAVSLVSLVYTGYRLRYFYREDQVLVPVGIRPVAYRPIQCQGQLFYQELEEDDYTGFSPLPCVKDSCRSFILRGAGIESGFRASP